MTLGGVFESASLRLGTTSLRLDLPERMAGLKKNLPYKNYCGTVGAITKVCSTLEDHDERTDCHGYRQGGEERVWQKEADQKGQNNSW